MVANIFKEFEPPSKKYLAMPLRHILLAEEKTTKKSKYIKNL